MAVKKRHNNFLFNISSDALFNIKDIKSPVKMQHGHQIEILDFFS